MTWEELYEENTRMRAELAENARAQAASDQQVAELREELAGARAEGAARLRAFELTLAANGQEVALLRESLGVVRADAAVKQGTIEQLRANVQRKSGELDAAHGTISLLKKERPQRLRAERQARMFARRARDASGINVILGGLAFVAGLAAANRDE